MKDEHVKRARLLDGSRRHDETMNMFHFQILLSRKASNEDSNKIIDAMTKISEKLTGEGAAQTQIKELREQQEKIKEDVVSMKDMLDKILAAVGGGMKRTGDK